MDVLDMGGGGWWEWVGHFTHSWQQLPTTCLALPLLLPQPVFLPTTTITCTLTVVPFLPSLPACLPPPACPSCHPLTCPPATSMHTTTTIFCTWLCMPHVSLVWWGCPTPHVPACLPSCPPTPCLPFFLPTLLPTYHHATVGEHGEPVYYMQGRQIPPWQLALCGHSVFRHPAAFYKT